MQEVRLWQVTPDEKLQPIPSNEISLENRLEDWLADDISVLGLNLLVIGRQVPTAFGGRIDLLCLDGNGDTVVVELKKGKTSREVTAQALDYASWIKCLNTERIKNIAEGYPGISGSLPSAFQEQFERPLPDDLNQNHSSLIVAESFDAATERIVRYLSDVGVRINVATVRHFRDATGKSILAQVYMIEPEEAENRGHGDRRRVTMNGLQDMAESNSIGALFERIRNGMRGLLSPEPYKDRAWYKLRRKEGGFRTVLIVDATPHEKSNGSGLGFRVHATRLDKHVGIDLEQLKTCLPENTEQTEGVRGWAGSSADERESAVGLSGYFQSQEEVDKFVSALRNAITQSRTT